MKKEKGITMIALVVTIVVLLILASITIGAVTSENGILRNANDAKEQTEIAEEKEIVDRATIQTMGNNSRGNIVEDELQEQLDKITGNGKTEADDVGEEFEVTFIESKRYYIVDKDGTVTGPQEIVDDKSPGDITKDENGDDLKGDEDQPYEIWCIEDLVEWSENYQNYQEANIVLGRTLNFKSNFSYSDGKKLGCNSIEELKNLLTNALGSGFMPITDFSGIFDGQGYEIRNIYINSQNDNVALIGHFYGEQACIKNLGITGIITSSGKFTGGIVASYNSGTIMNSYNKCEITGNTYAGGIIGYAYAVNVELSNCYNFGNITGKIAAGILPGNGGDNFKTIINNSFNMGNISSAEDGISGGIIGRVGTFTVEINNCYNLGQIKSYKNSGRTYRLF